MYAYFLAMMQSSLPLLRYSNVILNYQHRLNKFSRIDQENSLDIYAGGEET